MTPSRFAVFGHPIAQSLSPRIHTAFGRQLGIALEYVAVDAEPSQFAAALSQLAARGGVGANVTLPLKEEAFALATTRSERASRAGAVNTLVRREDGWHGDNTDGAGLVRDLTERHGLDLRGRRALLLGAGGAARGVAPALLEAGVREMVIINRSPPAPMPWPTPWASRTAPIPATGKTCASSAISSSSSMPPPPDASRPVRSRCRCRWLTA